MPIPKFAVLPTPAERDFSALSGAGDLARRIEAVWRLAGFAVRCRVVPRADSKASNRGLIFGIESDLVNGLPADFAAGDRAAAVAGPAALSVVDMAAAAERRAAAIRAAKGAT